MKLIVTIPAYNEEESIKDVIHSIPKQMQGIDRVEILVIDDGSTDNTKVSAHESGADHVISNKVNRGLATTFRRGINKALELGADIIVNTDADNQYDQTEIPKLIAPILNGQADIVSGDRQIEKLDHMPSSKKYGNMLGSWVVRKVSGLPIKDASSGFRAFSREAALRLSVLSHHTYTHETIIEAQDKKLVFIEVPCTFRARVGTSSRLISGVFGHIKKSGATIVRTTIRHRPLKTFVYIGGFLLLLGIIIGVRFIYFYMTGNSSGHIQSLIFVAILIMLGFQIVVLGLLADNINANRRINEEILYRLKKEQIKKQLN
ncbi:glycosyltransferase family 2 protein [Patescibacteria group bacterium]|nr:glycosyltransferase family 2 protein [Patescibacteria group bacterium]MBU0963420.1 glycosyltransferase family 2 protein [Patescibacteria group bacterium]